MPSVYKKKYYQAEKKRRQMAEPHCKVCSAIIHHGETLWYVYGKTICTACKDKSRARVQNSANGEYLEALRKHRGLA